MINTELDIDYSDLHHGKYDCPMAQYIEAQVMGNGDRGDEEWSDDMGNGWARFGRRVQSWNDQGFVACDTYATVQEAETVCREAMERIEALQDEQCAEQGCTACPICHAYDCGSCATDSTKGPLGGSSHVIGCGRDWIG